MSCCLIICLSIYLYLLVYLCVDLFVYCWLILFVGWFVGFGVIYGPALRLSAILQQVSEFSSRGVRQGRQHSSAFLVFTNISRKLETRRLYTCLQALSSDPHTADFQIHTHPNPLSYIYKFFEYFKTFSTTMSINNYAYFFRLFR